MRLAETSQSTRAMNTSNAVQTWQGTSCIKPSPSSLALSGYGGPVKFPAPLANQPIICWETVVICIKLPKFNDICRSDTVVKAVPSINVLKWNLRVYLLYATKPTKAP